MYEQACFADGHTPVANDLSQPRRLKARAFHSQGSCRILEKLLSKGVGHHIPPPLPHHGGPRIFKNVRKMYQMTPGWTLDRPKMSKGCSKSIGNPCKNNIWLPSELPQVTPETPNDHQQMFRFWQNMLNTFMNTPWESLVYSWMIHRFLLFMKNL